MIVLMDVARVVLAIATLLFLCWLMSSNRRNFPWRLVVVGILSQFALAWFLLETTIGLSLFQGASEFVAKLAEVFIAHDVIRYKSAGGENANVVQRSNLRRLQGRI